jgi:alpha-tubulin suppressor-like RCC1 family protein
MSGVKQIACGYHHVLALAQDGRVFGFGRNLGKECAVPYLKDRSIQRIFAADHLSGAVLSSSIVLWGKDLEKPIEVPIDAGEITHVCLDTSAIYVCIERSHVLRIDIEPIWHSKDLRRLAAVSSIAPVTVNLPTEEVPIGDRIVTKMVSGAAHTAILFDDGCVQCQGNNYFGQCSIVSGDVVDVAACAYTTLALEGDGCVRRYGYRVEALDQISYIVASRVRACLNQVALLLPSGQ